MYRAFILFGQQWKHVCSSCTDHEKRSLVEIVGKHPILYAENTLVSRINWISSNKYRTNA